MVDLSNCLSYLVFQTCQSTPCGHWGEGTDKLDRSTVSSKYNRAKQYLKIIPTKKYNFELTQFSLAALYLQGQLRP